MRGKTVLAALLLIGISAAPAWSQGLLPASFGGWTAAAPETHVSSAQVQQVAADKAAILREYGIDSADQRRYGQGLQSAVVTLYRMTDPTAAFGAFTFLRDAQMTPFDAGNPAMYRAGNSTRAIMVIGNIVLDISSPDAAKPGSQSRPADNDLGALAAVLLPHVDRRPFPDIAGYLPTEGLEAGSEHYVLGPQALAQAFPVDGVSPADWIGFDKSAEAIVARYHLDRTDKNAETTLVIALYPTQQIAEDKFESLGKWFNLHSDAAAEGTQTSTPAGALPGTAAPNGRPVAFGMRSSAMLALVYGISSRPVAVDFLDHIHYASTVTWNEPRQDLTDPGIGTMVVGAFLGTGAIMVMAVAAGIGFGGLRLLVKLVLPGKVFDSTRNVEILQLGLSSKPIRAEDFYELNSSKPG